MDSVFLLWYVCDINGREDEILIGVYTAEREAKAAIERLKSEPGFIEDPNGFQIHPYELNRDHWTKGFVLSTD